MRVGMVKNRQALLLGETDCAERVHQLSQVSRGKHWLWPRVQSPQIHHRLVNAPLPAHAGQFCQGRLAGGQVEMTVRTHADEFTGPDDLKFLRHIQGLIQPCSWKRFLSTSAISLAVALARPSTVLLPLASP